MEELKYYKGEQSNPFEEITEEQGAHCQRYNAVASLLWFFEYHWANGWAKYSKLEERHYSNYYEQHKEPQKEYSSIYEALAAFCYESSLLYPLHSMSSKRWQRYVYEHAKLERFYKPIYNIVPKEEVPAYLVYYRGEDSNPYLVQRTEAGVAKAFWWGFEMGWYTGQEECKKEAFEQHLHSYLMRASEYHPKSTEYKQELKAQLERYKSWSK